MLSIEESFWINGCMDGWVGHVGGWVDVAVVEVHPVAVPHKRLYVKSILAPRDRFSQVKFIVLSSILGGSPLEDRHRRPAYNERHHTNQQSRLFSQTLSLFFVISENGTLLGLLSRNGLMRKVILDFFSEERNPTRTGGFSHCHQQSPPTLTKQKKRSV